jgi:tRNA dimethylallyltransferase
MHSPIYIIGATSTGKSDFAVQLAERISGEVVSADSRQVYTELNLLSGKITPPEMRGVPHHMLSVTSLLDAPYTVSEYQKATSLVLENLEAKSKPAILCGGTGMYISSILHGHTYPEIPPNNTLREELSAKSAPELFELLQKADPVRAQNIDRHNKVRLVRALEIVTAIGTVPILQNSISYKQKNPPQIVQLVLPDEILKERIHRRIIARIEHGMIEELQTILHSGVSEEYLIKLGLECRYTLEYIKGIQTKEDYIKILFQKTWQYARRQRTWFRQYTGVVYVDPQDEAMREQVLRDYIKNTLKE